MYDLPDSIGSMIERMTAPPAAPTPSDRLWADISYHAFFEAYSHVLEFKVYYVNALGEKPLYEEKEPCSNSWVEDVTKSHVFLSGSIKWDGCCDLNFDEQDEIMLHFCSRKGATNIGVLLERLYDAAEEILPTWGGG